MDEHHQQKALAQIYSRKAERDKQGRRRRSCLIGQAALHSAGSLNLAASLMWRQRKDQQQADYIQSTLH